MAPDASITGYKTNIGGALYVIYLLAAIEDVLQKQQAGEIDVQIVNNSFGSSNDGDFNPTESIHVAYWEAFKEGIVPVFSAGNSGPDHGTLNYLGKQPFSLCVGATYDGDNGAAKLPTDFSSRGRPAVEDKGKEYASDYDFSKYEQNEGPFYDRQAALNDIQAFYESGQADAPEVEADYTDQFSVTVATTVTDPTAWTASLGVNGTLVGGDSVYVEWESPPGAGYLDAAIGVGEINRESVYVNLYRGDKETVSDGGGVLVAEDGNVIRDGQLEFGVPIDAETTYTFEFYGFNNVDTQVTANLTARQLVERPEGPFGTHRVDVSAPGNWIMSTAKETEILGGLYTALRQETEPLYTEVSGTSMSCPVTAGIVALVFEAYESEAGFRPKPIDVINIMEATAEGGTEAELAPHTEANMGAGFVDAEAAVKRAKELGAAVASQDGPSSDDPTEAEHPELWDEIELCRVGRGKSLR
jgi:subtilisin family serine protease